MEFSCHVVAFDMTPDRRPCNPPARGDDMIDPGPMVA